MAIKATFRLGLSGENIEMIGRETLDLGILGQALPAKVKIDAEPMKVTADWYKQALKKYNRVIIAEWGEETRFYLSKDTIVKVTIPDYEADVRRTLSILEKLHYELASFYTLYDEWDNGALSEVYDAPGFANLHWPHGWACAFREKGHDQLVSRRWLDFGPWRLVRGANDTSLVQFHDLQADAATALAQAKPGHERMGISATGGFMPIPYQSTYDISGLYHPDERALKIVVAGRDVPQEEMTDACAVRRFQMLGEDKPLDGVAYVFIEEAAAQKHLHELWLRELECWAIVDGREVRLDEDYHPKPEKPEWVRVVEEREGAS